MSALNYLTVDLFLYDLCHGLGRDSEQVEVARQRFWKRLYPEVNGSKPANIKDTDAFFASYVELLDGRVEVFSDTVDGYYYPVKLGDTYALQVDSSGEKNESQTANSIQDRIKTISADIIENRIRHEHGDIGENWLVWGQLNDPSQDVEAVARACYESLASKQNLDWNRDYSGKGSFGGANLFELEHPDYFPDGRNRNHHVLICLFPADQTKAQIQETIGKLYRHLIRLFHYRNKVLWLYEHSRWLKGFLKEASDKTDYLVGSLPDRMKDDQFKFRELQERLAIALKISYDYEIRLSYLYEQAAAIKTNINGYRDRTAKITSMDEHADLFFLDRFVALTEANYLVQIEADYAVFSSALNTLDKAIKTIQGITEIEHTQNERTLNQTVAIAGVGISVASLAASSLSDQAENIIQAWRPVPANQPTPVANFWLSAALILLLSLAIGGLAALITAAFVSKTSKK
ncbi:MAG: hypothetical protein F6J97_25270 [Leptolyngbya sp. SIO4C1]|nr:hypothetical protein [Leptolyngbya sp. SIO4C1]